MVDIDARISQIELITGYTFTEKPLCAEALQMEAPEVSYFISGSWHLVKKNKDLESVGDTIIAVVLCTKWYNFRDDQGKRLPVGIWDKLIRQKYLCNKNLARAGFAAGIDKCIIKNPGLVRATNDMVANTMEAVIGAAYLDSNESLDIAGSIMEKLGLNTHSLLTAP
ncbi:hypothetical protein CC86DRAFT_80144 [Ophiobolus disseminans]|uniref:RNase III domain-containing protein n=1 Tax=Ophiobolus disseminans TaxID=1469910 RepID=A0A6A6ZQM3_9PLEO|nr:hypothetical protein CC86DRAFT_80144 [Ophiobolus disseminans]